MKGAVVECEDSRGYPSSLPKYAIGHSLGCKLHTIGVAATGIGEELSGMGFISFNNFGFAETITMARSFAKEMELGGGFQGGGPAPFDALFDLAGMAIGAVGLEFTPSPDDLDRIVTSKLNDDEVSKKIRLFKFDDDDNRRPGWKFAEYEAKGVPVRLAMGPRDLENGKIEVARRDLKTKEIVNFEGCESMIQTLLEEIQKNLFTRAKDFQESRTQPVDSYEEFKIKVEKDGGFFLAHWDGTKETEQKIKEETKATIRCIPLDGDRASGECMVTGKPSQQRVIFAKAY